MPMQQQIITVIGSQFLQPIADLLARLTARPYYRPDRVGSNYYEGGYSASIILLVAATLESLIQRDRYFHRRENPGSKPSMLIAEYTKTILRYRRHAHLSEVFEVRNAIAHNHIWEIDFVHPSGGGRQHKRNTIVPETHRLRAIPSPTARIPRTKTLKLNLQPNRLDRTDVKKVLNAAVHALIYLSRRGMWPIRVHDEVVGFRRKRIRFYSLAGECLVG